MSWVLKAHRSKLELSASISENIAFQLVKRIGFRRAMKRAIEQAKNAGAEGILIEVQGRLDGADMSRLESYKWGKLPRQTLRADIDYGFYEASTTYGLIGIKVWVYNPSAALIGAKLNVELEAAVGGTPSNGVAVLKVPVTKSGVWEELVFDYSGIAGIPAGTKFGQLVLRFNDTVDGAGAIIYVDNFRLTN